MSLADEVLAEHVKDDPDPNWPAFPDRCKKDWQSWPCESARLATKLKAADRVIEEVRELARIFNARGKAPLQPFAETACIELVVEALAEYDKER